MKDSESWHTIAVLVENEFGVLARVAGMFAGRGFNIDALSVAPTSDPKVSRITLVTHGNEKIIEQILKQLNRIIDVLKVVDLSSEDRVRRELMLVKIRVTDKEKKQIKEVVQEFQGKILQEEKNILILEFVHDHGNNDSILEKLSSVEVLETARTGNLAMQKGKKTLAS